MPNLLCKPRESVTETILTVSSKDGAAKGEKYGEVLRRKMTCHFIPPLVTAERGKPSLVQEQTSRGASFEGKVARWSLAAMRGQERWSSIPA